MSKRSAGSSAAPQKLHAKKSKPSSSQSSLSGFFSSRSSSGGGTGKSASPIDLTTSSSPEGSPSKPSPPPPNPNRNDNDDDVAFKIYCDLDGVLVDFDAGVRRLFGGRGPDEIANPSTLWSGIHRSPSFYADLPWMDDGRELWDAIKHLNPDILTGVPRSNKSRGEKYLWCRRELGMPTNHVDMAGKKSGHEVVSGRRREGDGVVNVITCWSKNKHRESTDRAVLIDDRAALAEKWEENGGIFIHHTTTTTTIEQLKRRGILSTE